MLHQYTFYFYYLLFFKDLIACFFFRCLYLTISSDSVICKNIHEACIKKNRASPSRHINPHTSSDIYIKMYAIVPMYFTHTYTHLYIKYTFKVLVICSILGRNWGFSVQSVIIMKTGEKVPCRKGKL